MTKLCGCDWVQLTVYSEQQDPSVTDGYEMNTYFLLYNEQQKPWWDWVVLTIYNQLAMQWTV